MLDISNNIVHSDLFLKPITFERNIGLSYRNPPLPTINRETRWFKETASSEGRTPHRQQTHPWERRQTISAPRSRQRRTTRSSFRCSPFDRGYRSRSWSKSSGRRRSCTPPSRLCCSSGVAVKLGGGGDSASGDASAGCTGHKCDWGASYALHDVCLCPRSPLMGFRCLCGVG